MLNCNVASKLVLITGPFCVGSSISIYPGLVLGPLFPVVGEERGEDGFLQGSNILEQSLKLYC